MIDRIYSNRNSIRWKLLVGMTGLIISIMGISTAIQIQSQQKLLRAELLHRITYVKGNLEERGSTMSYNLALQAEDALASYNLYSFIRQVEKAIEDTPDLEYAIVMDTSGRAHVHTLYSKRQGSLLNASQDIQAAKATAFSMNEFTIENQKVLEFVTPLTLGIESWGFLRLGYSLENINRIISDSQENIIRQTRQMVWRSVLIAIAFILISAVILSVYTARLIKPLTELATTAKALSVGKFSEAKGISIKTKDEIAVLGKSFKEMAGQLEISYFKLENHSKTLEKKVAERTSELSTARDQALSATRAKSEFLAKMSHEIRTPMNAILGMADLLWESELTPEQKKFVQVFRSAGENLMVLINDILDLSKVEAGRMTLETRDFNLAEVVERCCDLMTFKAHEKKLDLVLEIEPQTPLMLSGDSNKLRQVLMNLIGNSIKFTNCGKIGIRICPKTPSQQENTHKKLGISFVVWDTGIGISHEKQKLIFEAFSQANSSINRTYGGTGLGLNICRHFIKMMGGEIHVHSKPGKGSSFEFTAYFDIQSQIKSPTRPLKKAGGTIGSPQKNSRNQRILLAEDAKENQFVVKAFLKQAPYDLEIAENGKIALDFFKKNSYDLILMDIQMPVMDGLSATRAIRQLEIDKNRHPVPVIALTAHAFESAGQECLDAGCNGYLTKPIKKEALLQTIGEILE